MTSDAIQRRIREKADRVVSSFETDFGDDSAQAVEKGGVMEVRFIGRIKIRNAIASALQEIADEVEKEERDRIINLIKTNKQAYMTPATEERFLKDLSSLTKEEEHEN